jgi:hypothetical protein
MEDLQPGATSAWKSQVAQAVVRKPRVSNRNSGQRPRRGVGTCDESRSGICRLARICDSRAVGVSLCLLSHRILVAEAGQKGQCRSAFDPGAHARPLPFLHPPAAGHGVVVVVWVGWWGKKRAGKGRLRDTAQTTRLAQGSSWGLQ